MVCDDCPLRSNCDILKLYQEAEELYRKGDNDRLRFILDMVELHESYISEMRRDLMKKVVSLT